MYQQQLKEIDSVYNRVVAERKKSIPTDRLSIITALIILNYALMPFIYSPEITLDFSILGIVFNFHLQYSNLMVLSASAFGAVGSYWLLYDHPLISRTNILIHLILPTLIAGVMSIPLNVITIGPAWWIVFALESALIIFTIIAEFYSVDPHNSLFALSKIILIPLSVGLILLLSISVRSADYRLYIEAFVLTTVFSIIFIRLNNLTETTQKKTRTLVSAFLFVQILTICHYLPLPSIAFGLVLTGFASFLISLPLFNSSQEKPAAAIRNASLYAIPFLVSALFFL